MALRDVIPSCATRPDEIVIWPTAIGFSCALTIAGAPNSAAAALFGAPAIVSAQEKPIAVGQITISSGRVAQLGITSRNAISLEIDAFNAAGGLNGRKLQLLDRDSKGKPDD